MALLDRVAAPMYGPVAFEEGLSHIVRKDVESHQLATKEIGACPNDRFRLTRRIVGANELPAAQDKGIESQFATLRVQTSARK